MLGKKGPRVNLLDSRTILRESIAAKALLEKDWGVAANIWSCPSFNELAREGQDADRWNLLHPTVAPRLPFVTFSASPALRVKRLIAPRSRLSLILSRWPRYLSHGPAWLMWSVVHLPAA